LKLAAVALALAGATALSACDRSNQGLGPREIALGLAALQAAPQHGFPAGRFHVQRIEQLLRSASRGDRAEGAREMRAALVDYARAQHGLTIPKSAFPRDWGLKPAAYDAEGTLSAALQDGDLKGWLAAQPSPLPAYRALQRAYVAVLAAQAAGGWPTVSPDTPLRPGAQGPEVSTLRRRLAYEDPQLAGGAPDAAVDAGLVAAVQRFQAAHGLPATGRLAAATVGELNVPVQARAAQIRANLERLRWLPREQPAPRIDVNTAAAVMDYYVAGKLAAHMLAASGKPGGDETPMLASEVSGIVLNPPWNVPQGIAETEILPKGPDYLERKGFEVKHGRLVQAPGPDAALGVVKFEFANPYAVYLHDTPAKAAFARSRRAVSHGCVRLAQAVGLAKAMLSVEPGWSPQRVDEVLAGGETMRVRLSRPVPVRLVYLTAFADGGRMAYRPDLYGWDRQLLALLDHPPAPRTAGRRT
jgi:murein L,D-transpeptidase YcbB/YkuD